MNRFRVRSSDRIVGTYSTRAAAERALRALPPVPTRPPLRTGGRSLSNWKTPQEKQAYSAWLSWPGQPVVEELVKHAPLGAEDLDGEFRPRRAPEWLWTPVVGRYGEVWRVGNPTGKVGWGWWALGAAAVGGIVWAATRKNATTPTSAPKATSDRKPPPNPGDDPHLCGVPGSGWARLQSDGTCPPEFSIDASGFQALKPGDCACRLPDAAPTPGPDVQTPSQKAEWGSPGCLLSPKAASFMYQAWLAKGRAQGIRDAGGPEATAHGWDVEAAHHEELAQTVGCA